MRQELTAAFAEYLAGNLGTGGRRNYYGVFVEWAEDDASVFDSCYQFTTGGRRIARGMVRGVAQRSSGRSAIP
jgi:hypothetical protein